MVFGIQSRRYKREALLRVMGDGECHRAMELVDQARKQGVRIADGSIYSYLFKLIDDGLVQRRKVELTEVELQIRGGRSAFGYTITPLGEAKLKKLQGNKA